MKITLADNWQTLHKRGTVLAAGAFAFIAGIGPSIVQAWNFIPPDMKALLPAGMARYATMAAFLLMIVVRYTAVRKAPVADAEPVAREDHHE